MHSFTVRKIIPSTPTIEIIASGITTARKVANGTVGSGFLVVVVVLLVVVGVDEPGEVDLGLVDEVVFVLTSKHLYAEVVLRYEGGS